MKAGPSRWSARSSWAKHWGKFWWAAAHSGLTTCPSPTWPPLLHQLRVQLISTLTVCAKESSLSAQFTIITSMWKLPDNFFLIRITSIVYSTNRQQYKLKIFFFPPGQRKLAFPFAFQYQGKQLEAMLKSLPDIEHWIYFNIINTIWTKLFLHTNDHECIETLSGFNLLSWQWAWFEQREQNR